jgi:hypothetical protein
LFSWEEHLVDEDENCTALWAELLQGAGIYVRSVGEMLYEWTEEEMLEKVRLMPSAWGVPQIQAAMTNWRNPWDLVLFL